MRKQRYFAQGKILLFGEYFVLFGSKAIAIPTKIGQHLLVRQERSYNPKLIWESFDVEGKKWFESKMDLWHFDSENPEPSHKDLQVILQKVRRENPHFLRESERVHVETRLEFPLEWGLGSSSSLVHNIAQWARVNPYDLAAESFGGSGYDIACAKARGPILYRKDKSPIEREPFVDSIYFDPPFIDQLYLVYLGRKEKTSEHLQRIERGDYSIAKKTLEKVNQLVKKVRLTRDLGSFESLIREYESLVQESFHLERIKDQHFSDYWGEIKSLGAWGGDFILATSGRDKEETSEYFRKKGYKTCLEFKKLISQSFQKIQPFMLSEKQAYHRAKP